MHRNWILSAVLPLVVFSIGCAGAANSLLNQLNPFAGSYSGTLDYTSTSTNEPITLNVNGNGHVTGSFTDPNFGNGSLSGNVANDGTVSGTTLNGATPGTFTFNLTSGANNHFTGNGTFTINSTAQPVTLDITKS